MPYGADEPARGGGDAPAAAPFSLPAPRRAAPGIGREPVGGGRGGGEREPPQRAGGLVPAHTDRPAVAVVSTVTLASGSGDKTGEGGGPADRRARVTGSMGGVWRGRGRPSTNGEWRGSPGTRPSMLALLPSFPLPPPPPTAPGAKRNGKKTRVLLVTNPLPSSLSLTHTTFKGGDKGQKGLHSRGRRVPRAGCCCWGGGGTAVVAPPLPPPAAAPAPPPPPPPARSWTARTPR